MKKYFMYVAFAAASLLTSCSSESLTAGDDPQNPNSEDRVPIEIGVATIPNAAITRGSGTVGGVENGGAAANNDGTTTGTPAANIWKGQKVKVFMYDKGTLNLALDEGNIIYNNTELTTPSETDALSSGQAKEYLTATTIQHRYYPLTGNFDFWGYHIDDALELGAVVDGETTAASTLVDGDTEVQIPFVIDGTQDLMVAKAVPTAADLNALGTLGGADAANRERFYSSFSARKDVQPELTFKHLLTRLSFSITGGNAAACGWNTSSNTAPAATTTYNGVFVKSLKIYSKTTGYIVAAYTRPDMSTDDRYTDPAKLIKFDDTDGNQDGIADNYLPLELRGTTLTAGNLDPLYPTTVTTNWEDALVVDGANWAKIIRPTASYSASVYTFDKVPFGSALLVEPAQTYEMVVELGQYLLDVEDTSNPTNNTPIVKSSTTPPIVVALSTPGAYFLPGHSYNINITAYGYEEIKITTTLEPWVYGEEINSVID